MGNARNPRKVGSHPKTIDAAAWLVCKQVGFAPPACVRTKPRHAIRELVRSLPCLLMNLSPPKVLLMVVLSGAYPTVNSTAGVAPLSSCQRMAPNTGMTTANSTVKTGQPSSCPAGTKPGTSMGNATA